MAEATNALRLRLTYRSSSKCDCARRGNRCGSQLRWRQGNLLPKADETQTAVLLKSDCNSGVHWLHLVLTSQRCTGVIPYKHSLSRVCLKSMAASWDIRRCFRTINTPLANGMTNLCALRECVLDAPARHFFKCGRRSPAAKRALFLRRALHSFGTDVTGKI